MRKSLFSAAVFPFLFAAAFSGVPAAFAAFDAAPTFLSQEDAEQSRKRAAKEDWSEVFADGLFKADGEEVPVSALRKKKYVGVYVSASWCGPCRAFTPELVELYKEYERDLEIVLIGADRSQDEVFKYARDHGMPWLVAKQGAAANGYMTRHGVRGIPDFRLFDKNGKLLEADGRNLKVVRAILDGKKRR